MVRLNTKTIFLFLCARPCISDLLQTPYIAYLSTKYRVVVFLPKGNGVDLKSYFQHDNVTYVSIPAIGGRFFTIFDGLLRNELIRRFDENPAVIWRNKRAKDPRRLFLRKVGALFPKRLIGPSLFTFLEQLFVPQYALFKQYVKKYAPALVLVTTPGIVPFDALALLWARKADIPTVAVNFGWDNLTVYPRHVRKTDYLICWNARQKRDAETLHSFNPARVFISGIIRFDHYFRTKDDEPSREAFLKSKGLDPHRKTVLYAAKTHGTFYKDFIRAFIQWQKEKAFGEPVNLFVRLHPLDSLSDFEEFLNLPGVHVERASAVLKQADTSPGHKVEMNEDDLFNMKYTLKYSDVCVNMASTVAVEAMVFDKPVICAGFVPQFSEIASFDHFRPLIEYESVSVAKSMNDIKTYLNRYLENPTLHAEGRKKVVEYLVRPTDGFSYKRNVDFLESVLKNENVR